MGRNKRLLGMLVKYPAPGEVKTRLGREIGFGKAAALYRAVAERVLSATRPVPHNYGRVIFYSPSGGRQDFQEWLPGEEFMPQRGEDLGEIMANALADLLEGGADSAVLTGVDIPDLTREVVCDAFEQLEGHDVVFGPAQDGGYYLVGMKTLHPALFCSMPWGSSEVLQATLRAAEVIGLSCGLGPKLSDVDRLEDIRGIRR